MVDICQEKFPLAMLNPPKFEEWIIHACRYKNANPTISMEENSKYVIMQQSMVDKEGYAVLLPTSRERGTVSGMPNVIHHWGRVCQLASPMGGRLATSMLPMVGCASDSQIHVQFEWTYQLANERRMVRKVGKMELERLPSIKTVEQNTGYVWEGTLEVTIEDCHELTMQSQKKSNPVGNNGMHNLPTNITSPTVKDNTNKEQESVTQLYYIEMVIDQSENKKKMKENLMTMKMKPME